MKRQDGILLFLPLGLVSLNSALCGGSCPHQTVIIMTCVIIRAAGEQQF